MAKRKIKKTPKKKKPSKRPMSSVEKTYRNIFIGFAVITVLVVIFVLYFSLSKTTITITPNDVPVTTTFSISVRTEPDENAILSVLHGEFIQTTLTRTHEYTELTSTEEQEVKAVGTVTLYNNYSKDQPLVATTRLLSKESNVLFRTTETVTVPAGGSITANVEADLPGETGNIGPDTFTIVALWPAMQELIYAESTEKMSLGVKDVTIAAEEDILAAKVKNREALSAKAVTALRDQVALEGRGYPLSEDIVHRLILEESTDVEADDETDAIIVTTEARFTGVLFDHDELTSIAREHLLEMVEDHVSVETFTSDMITFSLINVDSDEGTAELKVTAEAATNIKLSHPVFDRSQFAGRDAQEIRTYLSDFEEITDVSVEFFPFWVYKAPSLEDHIEILLAD